MYVSTDSRVTGPMQDAVNMRQECRPSFAIFVTGYIKFCHHLQWHNGNFFQPCKYDPFAAWHGLSG